MKRTHTCGELRKGDVKKEVILQGWVQSRRDHGGLIFIDLRDRYGLTQVAFDPTINAESHKLADTLRREFVIEVHGKVRARPEGMANPNMATGDVEVICDKQLEILNKAETPPLEIEDRIAANEDMRLKYRYLDLRRPSMLNHFIVRHKAAMAAREFLAGQGFLEVETPLLIRSTPEGARDYIVPSRVNPGKAYSLPQSPQLYKQILMVSGFDRYFQVARCLRDEDLRADRQPEFTQIDIEMTFVEQEDVFKVIEGLMKHMFKQAISHDLKIPFQRLTYDESMKKYGCDKPDLRFGLELIDVTEVLKDSEFNVFKSAPLIKCLNAKGCGSYSRTQLEELTALAVSLKAKGMIWIKVVGGKLESSVVKYITEKQQKELMEKTGAKDGDLLLLIADKPTVTNPVMAGLRNELGKRLKLYNPSEFKFCWIIDFPLYEWNEDEERFDAAHHIFTMPKAEDMHYLETDPSKVRAQCYDLVLNGIEVASGSIRIHRSDIQERVMKVIGLTHRDAEKKFGFLLEAFKYGAPPHGGIAPGFDRLVALMLGFNDIREVIAFPKNKSGECPMDGCPSEQDEKVLKENHIKFEVGKK